MKIEWIDVNDIQGAKYNPRIINDEQFQDLQSSIRELGMMIPIIVNRKNMTIIAGHQRTKACKAIGVEKVPAFFVDNITIADEMTFNQLHNDTDITKASNMTCDETGNGFCLIGYQHFSKTRVIATIKRTICSLVAKYGNVLCAIVCKGNVLVGQEYIEACRSLKISVNCFIADDSLNEDIVKWFKKSYGQFSYEHLKKDTYVQGLAQMHRIVCKTDKVAHKSRTYEELVIPYLKKNPNSSILDFGCGKGAYCNALKQNGYNIIGVEFYNNNKKAINVSKGNQQIDVLIDHLKKHGLFDVIVCDSVINSTDSIEAEMAVLGTLCTFAKQNGFIFISGRPLNSVIQRHTKSSVARTSLNSEMRFLDKNNFSAIYREGKWYYQHFHDKNTIRNELNTVNLEVVDEIWDTNAFRMMLKKKCEIPNEQKLEAINFEFNLPLPNGKSYNRNLEVVEALGL